MSDYNISSHKKGRAFVVFSILNSRYTNNETCDNTYRTHLINNMGFCIVNATFFFLHFSMRAFR